MNTLARWMNQPVKRVHVYTWALAKRMPDNQLLRVVSKHRTKEERAFRLQVARVVMDRRKLGKVYLPAYVEDQARYVFTSPLKYDTAEGAIQEISMQADGSVWLRQWTRINPGMLQLCWIVKNGTRREVSA